MDANRRKKKRRRGEEGKELPRITQIRIEEKQIYMDEQDGQDKRIRDKRREEEELLTQRHRGGEEEKKRRRRGEEEEGNREWTLMNANKS